MLQTPPLPTVSTPSTLRRPVPTIPKVGAFASSRLLVGRSFEEPTPKKLPAPAYKPTYHWISESCNKNEYDDRASFLDSLNQLSKSEVNRLLDNNERKRRKVLYNQILRNLQETKETSPEEVPIKAIGRVLEMEDQSWKENTDIYESPDLNVLIQKEYRRPKTNEVIKDILHPEPFGIAPDYYMNQQKKYLRELPRATSKIIEQYINTPTMTHYFVGSMQRYYFPFLHPVPRERKREINTRTQLNLVNAAILKAPKTPVPLILYHGSHGMSPFEESQCQGKWTPLFIPVGATAVTSVFTSFDNNLTLSLYGRGGREGYWDSRKHCCLWRLFVPKGFPLLFVEGRNHVLLPKGTELQITNRQTIRFRKPFEGYPPQERNTVLLMYDMKITGMKPLVSEI